MELKFRVWNGETMISPDYITRDGYAHWKENSIPNASNKLMMYTTKQDLKGNPIYEGDIISVRPIGSNHPIKYVVVFNDDLSFKMRFIDRYNNNESSFYDEEIHPDRCNIFEVIGNIHQNTELCPTDK